MARNRGLTCAGTLASHGPEPWHHMVRNGGLSWTGISIHHIRGQFRNPQGLLPRLLAECGDDPAIDEASIIHALSRLDAAWHLFIDKTQAHLMLTLVERVTLRPDSMAIRWNLRGLAALIRQIRSQPATDQAD